MIFPRTPWNKGRSIGPKRHFTAEQITTLERHLEDQPHDLALLSTGLDSLLRASDLLSLRVSDVSAQGRVRARIALRQQKTGQSTMVFLTKPTRLYLGEWIRISQKAPGDFLFSRNKGAGAAPITRGHYADLVKHWADICGEDPGEFSTHSIRRTKPVHMYWQGEDIALISRMLGHRSVVSTMEYLGLTQAKVEALALQYPMMSGPK